MNQYADITVQFHTKDRGDVIHLQVDLNDGKVKKKILFVDNLLRLIANVLTHFEERK
jgi:hypothetical protein